MPCQVNERDNRLQMLARLKYWARQVKSELYALYLAYRDPRVPWYARLLAICVVGYAFSPIDLIPDPIPILGYLDDLVIVPAGIWLTLKLMPEEVMIDCRKRARQEINTVRPTNWIAASVVIAIWVILALIAVFMVMHVFGR